MNINKTLGCIGIMGAMPEEINGIKQLMAEIETIEIGGRQYHTGKIANNPVVLSFSRWGKVASSITATTLINKFSVDKIVFTGVAGAISHQLRVGDIVIADKLFQHDMDGSPILPKYEVPLTKKTFFSTDQELKILAKQAAERCINKNNSCNKVIVGTIATGDQFISCNKRKNVILNAFPQTLAAEMEGCSVAQACDDHNVPFVIIRIISDNAENKSPIDFQEFIENHASIYSKEIIEALLSQKGNDT